jgi:hypothetical protein
VRVIDYKYLPARLPTFQTATGGLLLERLHAPPEVWGAAIVIAILFWTWAIYSVATQRRVHPRDMPQ